MTQLFTPEAPAPAIYAECRRVEAQTPGWRCIWLPRHGVYMAFLDADEAPPGTARPFVAEHDADAVLEAIRGLRFLRDAVRSWMALQDEGSAS